MVNNEHSPSFLTDPSKIIVDVLDKEREIIQGCPPVFIRLFGDIDYKSQLNAIPAGFRSKIFVLTTSDTPLEIISSLKDQQWNIIQSKEVTSEQARKNTALLQNEGLRYAKEQNQSYAFFLASGFQQYLPLFSSMFIETANKYPNQDAYYFVLPEIHKNVNPLSHKQMKKNNIIEFMQRAFPSETALVMSTSMPQFETYLSAKGNLGKMADGTELGGMEFFMTLLDEYKKAKDRGESFSPNMLGITFPINTRFDRTVEPLEITPTPIKKKRRTETWNAAIKKLGIIYPDIRKIFFKTQFKDGMDCLKKLPEDLYLNWTVGVEYRIQSRGRGDMESNKT